MNEKEDELEDVFELDLPQREIKSSLILLIFKQYDKLGSLLYKTDSAADPRIEFLTDFIIAHVPEEKTRDELLEFKKNEIKRLITEFKNNGGKSINTISNNDMGELKREACMSVLHKVMAFLDTSIGISHKIEVYLE